MALYSPPIEVVFAFIGAIGASSMFLFFPGIAYIVALNRYASEAKRRSCNSVFYHAMAWIFLICYVAIIGAYFYL